MVGQLIQNLVWIFPNGSTANTKPCLDTSKWWINGPSKTIWMDLNGSTACYQHCSNGITMCVQKQWAFLKVEILNGFKWSISRRVNGAMSSQSEQTFNRAWNRCPSLRITAHLCSNNGNIIFSHCVTGNLKLGTPIPRLAVDCDDILPLN